MQRVMQNNAAVFRTQETLKEGAVLYIFYIGPFHIRSKLLVKILHIVLLHGLNFEYRL